jgi:toluene monooxygenase system ferredoxin subunit
MPWKAVLREEELWIGEKLGLEIAGQKLLLVNVDGAVHAFEDRCAHQAWPLSQGWLVGRELTCSLHQWKYDACTGAGLNPAGVALRAYAVRIAGGEIWVDLGDGSTGAGAR